MGLNLEGTRLGVPVRVGIGNGEIQGTYAGKFTILGTDGKIQQTYGMVSFGTEQWLVPANYLAAYKDEPLVADTPPVPEAVPVQANEPPAHEVSISTGDIGGQVSDHP